MGAMHSHDIFHKLQTMPKGTEVNLNIFLKSEYAQWRPRVAEQMLHGYFEEYQIEPIVIHGNVKVENTLYKYEAELKHKKLTRVFIVGAGSTSVEWQRVCIAFNRDKHLIGIHGTMFLCILLNVEFYLVGSKGEKAKSVNDLHQLEMSITFSLHHILQHAACSEISKTFVDIPEQGIAYNPCSMSSPAKKNNYTYNANATMSHNFAIVCDNQQWLPITITNFSYYEMYGHAEIKFNGNHTGCASNYVSISAAKQNQVLLSNATVVCKDLDAFPEVQVAILASSLVPSIIKMFHFVSITTKSSSVTMKNSAFHIPPEVVYVLESEMRDHPILKIDAFIHSGRYNIGTKQVTSFDSAGFFPNIMNRVTLKIGNAEVFMQTRPGMNMVTPHNCAFFFAVGQRHLGTLFSNYQVLDSAPFILGTNGLIVDLHCELQLRDALLLIKATTTPYNDELDQKIAKLGRMDSVPTDNLDLSKYEFIIDLQKRCIRLNHNPVHFGLLKVRNALQDVVINKEFQ